MKLGLIVNPIAGMGGKVGLKGTDSVLAEAVAEGAEPVAPRRAVEFLTRLKMNAVDVKVEVLCCPKIMGEYEAKTADFVAEVLPMKLGSITTAKDTKEAVRLLVEAEVDLVVFVGGDGTARDVFDALQSIHAGDGVLALGVPSGVKMYSGVFAVSPLDAVEVVLAFGRKEASVADFEVMDADEKAIRSDNFSVRLYGYLKGPSVPLHIQGSKHVSPETIDERENQEAIAKFVAEELLKDATVILGPGTTVKCLADLLGVDKTLLGVDVYHDGKVILDVNEKHILEHVKDWSNTWIVVSPIGHQGIVFGRGNQQISSEIIKRIGRERILVLATKGKLRSVEGGVLRVDTGDAETDELLKGYGKVVTDYREWRLVQIQ
jgi:predicted polyphosphate/ATP-dependent NAD kinase